MLRQTMDIETTEYKQQGKIHDAAGGIGVQHQSQQIFTSKVMLAGCRKKRCQHISKFYVIQETSYRSNSGVLAENAELFGRKQF